MTSKSVANIENEGSQINTSSFKLDHDVYAEIASSAELFELKLVGSAYSVKPEVFEFEKNLEKLNHSFSGHCAAFKLANETGIALSHYQWVAEVKLGRKKVLKLDTSYLISYSELADFDEEHVELFVNKVGRFATYPYFRSLFSHHMSESGIIFPPLPILKERVD